MRRARLTGALVGVAALALAVEPAAAQASINDELISGLNYKLLYIAVPITVLVEGILVYTVWRFRNADEAQPTQENRRLEITWTVATAIILLFVGVASYQVFGSAFVAATASGQTAQLDYLSQDYGGATLPTEENAVEVEIVGQRYFWTYKYPHLNVSDRTSTGGQALVIPANTTVYLHITSTDWLHAVHVPDLGWKQDAVPGQYNTIKTYVFEPGTYQLYCAEYCGVGHSQMLGRVTVLPHAENPNDPAQGTWEYFLQQQRGGGNGGGAQNGTNATNTTNATSVAVAN